MNIKYRLLCKRLIEERKRVGVIQYYNVLVMMVHFQRVMPIVHRI